MAGAHRQSRRRGPPLKHKKLRLAVGAALLLALAAAGARLFSTSVEPDVLPAFRDPAPGRRAPRTGFLDLRLGSSTLAEAHALAHRLQVECQDSSVRALMQAQRAHVQHEMEQVQAQGGDPDGVTGASAVGRVSPKERNPQVRLSCTDVSTALFTDRARSAGVGRWLMVFDAADRPLRHASLQRRLPDRASAVTEWQRGLDAFTAWFGPPTALHPPQADDPSALTGGTHVEARWSFSDLEARLTLFSVGGRISLQERVEVPWPVRADAPALPSLR